MGPFTYLLVLVTCLIEFVCRRLFYLFFLGALVGMGLTLYTHKTPVDYFKQHAAEEWLETSTLTLEQAFEQLDAAMGNRQTTTLQQEEYGGLKTEVGKNFTWTGK